MKTLIKKEIENIYSLFNKTPKLNVKSFKQHILNFADKPEHYQPNKDNKLSIKVTGLRREINRVQGKKQCAFCARSTADVQSSLKDKSYEEEYRISALCGSCQDQVFIGPQYLRKEVQ